MLDDSLKTQLAAYLTRITQPVELIASLHDRPASQEMRELRTEIAELSPLVTARFDGADARRPSFQVNNR